jgi:hypothetical protein
MGVFWFFFPKKNCLRAAARHERQALLFEKRSKSFFQLTKG